MASSRQSTETSAAILQKKSKKSQRPVKYYGMVPRFLLLNNTVLFFLWFSCAMRLLILLALVGRKFTPGAIAEFYQGLLTVSFTSQWLLSVFEIIRVPRNVTRIKLFKLVHGLLITWGVIFHYPKVSKHTAYGVLVCSVALQEMTNYFYYLFRARLLRSIFKNNFILLFPVQRISELILLLVSFKFNKKYISQYGETYEIVYGYFLKGLVLLYIPCSYIIYRFLWSRRKL